MDADDAGRGPKEQEDREHRGHVQASALVDPGQHGLDEAGYAFSEYLAELVHDQTLAGTLPEEERGQRDDDHEDRCQAEGTEVGYRRRHAAGVVRQHSP